MSAASTYPIDACDYRAPLRPAESWQHPIDLMEPEPEEQKRVGLALVLRWCIQPLFTARRNQYGTTPSDSVALRLGAAMMILQPDLHPDGPHLATMARSLKVSKEIVRRKADEFCDAFGLGRETGKEREGRRFELEFRNGARFSKVTVKARGE